MTGIPIAFEMPTDEYSGYAGTFLGSARDHMGLRRDEQDNVADLRIAGSLVSWYASERAGRVTPHITQSAQTDADEGASGL
jgi:hypothetical protein